MVLRQDNYPVSFWIYKSIIDDHFRTIFMLDYDHAESLVIRLQIFVEIVSHPESFCVSHFEAVLLGLGLFSCPINFIKGVTEQEKYSLIESVF